MASAEACSIRDQFLHFICNIFSAPIAVGGLSVLSLSRMRLKLERRVSPHQTPFPYRTVSTIKQAEIQQNNNERLIFGRFMSSCPRKPPSKGAIQESKRKRK